MRRVLLIPSGALVWAVHFAAIYGITALACARGFAHVVPWTVGIAGSIAVALLVVIMRATYAAEFVGWTTSAIAGAALLAIVWESLAGFLVPACV
jgi:hypothetical protein